MNVTTPYQTFWLMVTAEPNYAVVDPSPQIVLYSVKQTNATDNRALPITSDLFFFTHYSGYESTPGELSNVPNQLLQARKAVELASKSGVLAADRSGSAGLKEEDYTREALTQATAFLDRAETAYKKDPKDREVVQFARTAAQSAENARALAMGAVGGLLVRQLENEVASLREELARLKSARPADPATAGAEVHTPADRPAATPSSAARARSACGRQRDAARQAAGAVVCGRRLGARADPALPPENDLSAPCATSPASALRARPSSSFSRAC